MKSITCFLGSQRNCRQKAGFCDLPFSAVTPWLVVGRGNALVTEIWSYVKVVFLSADVLRKKWDV